jgi:hypothetical protein
VPGFEWQLIENTIVEKYNISIEKADLKQYYIDKVLTQYFPQTDDEESKKRMDELADRMLESDKEVSKQLYEAVFEDKLTATLKANMQIKEETIDSDKFEDLIKAKNEKTKA